MTEILYSLISNFSFPLLLAPGNRSLLFLEVRLPAYSAGLDRVGKVSLEPSHSQGKNGQEQCLMSQVVATKNSL